MVSSPRTHTITSVLGGLALLALVTALAPPARATSPDVFVYQARVVDGGGTPLDQTLDVVFRIYASAQGGGALYSEAHLTTGGDAPPVTATQGLVSVRVGESVALPAAFFESANDYWLGVTFGTDAELAPRLRLSGVPFASRAALADDVAGRDITPNSVTVNGQPVIDATGAWVGLGGPGAGGLTLVHQETLPGTLGSTGVQSLESDEVYLMIFSFEYASTATVDLRFSTNGTSVNTSTNYKHWFRAFTHSGLYGDNGGNDQPSMVIHPTVDAGGMVQGQMTIHTRSTATSHGSISGSCTTETPFTSVNFGGVFTDAPVQGISWAASTGLLSGTYTIYRYD